MLYFLLFVLLITCCPTESLSLDQVIQMVRQKNPELSHFRSQLAIAEREAKLQSLPQNPSLDVSYGKKREQAASFVQEGHAFSISLMQPLEWGGRLSLKKAIADKDIDLARIGMEAFESDLLGKTDALLASLQGQAELNQSYASRLNGLQALLKTMVQRDTAGIAPVLEVRQLQAVVLLAERDLLDGQLSVQKTLLHLNRLLARSPDEPLEIKPFTLEFLPVPDLPVLMDLARAGNFSLLSTKKELEKQGIVLRLSRKNGPTQISAGPVFSKEKTDTKESIVGVGFSMDLNFWRKPQQISLNEESRQAQAQARYDASLREVEQSVAENWLILQSRTKSLHTSKELTNQNIQESVSLADQHFRLGAIPLNLYLELNQKMQEASQSMATARQEAIDAALRLETLTGKRGYLVKISGDK